MLFQENSLLIVGWDTSKIIPKAKLVEWHPLKTYISHVLKFWNVLDSSDAFLTISFETSNSDRYKRYKVITVVMRLVYSYFIMKGLTNVMQTIAIPFVTRNKREKKFIVTSWILFQETRTRNARETIFEPVASRETFATAEIYSVAELFFSDGLVSGVLIHLLVRFN